MAYAGDIRLGTTIDRKFATVNQFGVPTTLAGSPVISAYIGNDLVQLTAGITLSVDFDGVTGLHNVRVVATSGNGYATATDVTLVITVGTVNSISVVGMVVGSFSIENRSGLMPTTAARTLDVAATGEAGLDFDNIKDASGAHTLTNIRVPNVTLVDTVTAVTGLTAGNLDATVSSRATPAQVKTQMTDALNVDTYAEIGQETPAATQTLRKMLGYLYKAWRNRSNQTDTLYQLFADNATTVDQKAAVSDDDTTFESGEKTTGP